MAEVYKAYDSKLERFVAIKFLTRTLLRDKTARKRFLREARAASSLNHPNIAVVYELGQHDGIDYIVMEFIDGVTLGDEIEKGPLSPLRLVEIMRQCTSALSKAHASNVIHRDIKPDNIMITKEGLVKIMDFGLAKTTHTTKITPVGYALGTPAYMSPEQAQRTEVDGRCDIFSLGVVMYEALSGDVPFSGDTEISVMYQIVHEKQKPLANRELDVPNELAAIVDTCLAKNPNIRYQTCDDLNSDIERVEELFSQGHSDLPQSSALQAEIRRRKIRKLAIPGVVGLFIIALVGIYLFFIIPFLHPDKPRVAVLPIQDSTEEKVLTSHNWPLAFALSTTLEQSERLEVIPHIRVQSAFTALYLTHDRELDLDTVRKLAEMLQVDYLIWGLVNNSKSGLTLTARISELPTWIWENESVQAETVADLYKRIDTLTIAVRKKLEPHFNETDISRKSLGELTTFSYEALVYFVEAERLINQLDIGPADMSLQKAVELDSSFALANALLATTKRFHGAPYEEAEEFIARAERHLDGLQEKEKNLVRLLGLDFRGDKHRGLALATEMEFQYPNDERVLVNVGTMYWGCHRLDDAKRVFENIRKKNPWHLYSLDALGNIAVKNKDWNSAEKYFATGVKIAPLIANGHHSLGFYYFYRGRYEEAIEAFDNSNRLRPGRASIELGIAYELLGRLYLAEHNFRASLLTPFKAREIILSTHYLAQLMKRIGRHKYALELYQAQLQKHPDNAFLMANMGTVLLAMEDTTACNEILITLARIDTSQNWLIFLRAQKYRRTGNYNSAINDLERTARFLDSKDNMWAHELRAQIAEIYLEFGQAKKALSMFLDLDKIYPRRPYVLQGLAQCYIHLNHSRKAIECYEEMLKIYHDSKEMQQEKLEINAKIEKLENGNKSDLVS